MFIRALKVMPFFALLTVMVVGVGVVGAAQILDDLGREIVLREPARRIIPLYGAFAEMLFAIEAGEGVIARTQADEYPPEIKKLPSVGTHMRPNVEMILGLKPDLVIQSASRHQVTAEIERLREAGIPVAVFAPETFDGIFSTMERLGVLTGRESRSQEAVGALKKRLEAVKSSLSGVTERKRVFFEIRAEPLTAAGRGAIIQQVLLAAGAENVVTVHKAIVQYSLERLLVDNPDTYLVQQGPMNRNPADPKARPHFDRLRAVREGRIVFVDEFLYSRPGPRCVDAVEELAGVLYPGLIKRRGL